jgi:hypothetical protein
MSSFDPTQFADEVHYMSTDINTGIDDTMYESLIMFLQRLSGANDSALPKTMSICTRPWMLLTQQ